MEDVALEGFWLSFLFGIHHFYGVFMREGLAVISSTLSCRKNEITWGFVPPPATFFTDLRSLRWCTYLLELPPCEERRFFIMWSVCFSRSGLFLRSSQGIPSVVQDTFMTVKVLSYFSTSRLSLLVCIIFGAIASD